MAQPPSIRQIAAGTMDNALRMLQKFVQEVGDALSGQLTMGQNHAAQWVEMEFTDTIFVQSQRVDRLRGQAVKGVTVQGYRIVTGFDPGTAIGHSWVMDGDKVRITLLTALGPGTRMRVTFLVLPE